MTVPFLDLKAQYEPLKAEMHKAIDGVLDKCAYILGDAVGAFEKEFADYCGVKHAIAVNSGTSALHMALLASQIGPGDEVITVSHTFVATTAAILYAGAKPVFVDVEPKSLTMDPSLVEKAITARTKALLPVHLYGQPADMSALMAIAKKHGLKLIEDACQAHGAQYNGIRTGSMGDLGCFSFYPGKNLGAYGEGGAVTTNDAEYAKRIRMLRDWGQDRKYNHLLKGYNYRMDGIQGAVLGVKLRHLEDWTEARRRHAARYNELLKGVVVPTELPGRRHVYHVYAIRVPKRDEFQNALTKKAIQTGIHYPIPVHLQPAYAELGYRAGQLPQTEAAANETLSLPMYPELTPELQDQVIGAVKEIAQTI
jgi:dTDP-4-amino-4,6-dideoxygalactose transaminase